MSTRSSYCQVQGGSKAHSPDAHLLRMQPHVMKRKWQKIIDSIWNTFGYVGPVKKKLLKPNSHVSPQSLHEGELLPEGSSNL